MSNRNGILEEQYVIGWLRQKVQIYYDPPTFSQYICDARAGTPLNVEEWRVQRLVYDTSTFDNLVSKTVANYGEYVNPATNLATVQALTYT